MNEVWRDIPDFPQFQVSDHGRVRNLRTKRILGAGFHNGRVRVTLHKRAKQHFFWVHRLVAEAFLPDFREGYSIVHKDGDFTNNHVSNLAMGGYHATRLPKDVLVEVLETGEKYPSMSAAARAVGGQKGNVRRVLEGTLNHHKGYTFRFVKA